MLFALAIEQLKCGHQPLVLSIGKPGEEVKVIETGMHARNIPFHPFRMGLIPSFNDLKKLVGIIKSIHPDVIHSHGYKGNIFLAFGLRFFIRKPMITTMHGWVSVGKGFSRLRVYEWLDSFAVRWFDGIVLVSEKMMNHRRIQGWSVGLRSKVLTIENGISEIAEPVDEGFLQQLKDYSDGSLLIGSVGRMSKEKGYQFLIPAFSRLLEHRDDVRLVLIGAGSYQEVLDRLIDEHQLEGKVWITGYVENAGAAVGELDIYVCSSLTEGLPITLLEAMRESVPIISTAISNIPALLQNGRGGSLVAPSDTEALADTIEALLVSDTLRRNYISASRHHFLLHYSSKIMSTHYHSLYQSVLESELLSGGA